MLLAVSACARGGPERVFWVHGRSIPPRSYLTRIVNARVVRRVLDFVGSKLAD